VLPHRTFWLRDLPLLLTLLLIGGSVRIWIWRHTEVMARDGIGYVRFAARLDHEPWSHVLADVQQHPLYSINVLAATKIMRLWTHEDSPETWQQGAQLANVCWGTLLALPLYGIGRRLFDCRVGFWGPWVFSVYRRRHGSRPMPCPKGRISSGRSWPSSLPSMPSNRNAHTGCCRPESPVDSLTLRGPKGLWSF